jgi:diguanylate cyclase (GGDEF)-like protein
MISSRPQAAPDSSDLDAGETRVLIADDDDGLRLALEQAVEILGYASTTARDGMEAWERFQAVKPDIVLLDWLMPGMDGVDLCRRIRDHASDDSGYTYVIFLTALRETDRLVEAMHAGADDYLTKPFELIALEMRLAVARRITSLYAERAHQADQLRHQALHDALTGLPNRALLQDRLSQALMAANREGGPTALLLLDLDRFKDVNDTLGHEAGDLLLNQMASRFRSLIRDSDTVARLGGDEFAILLPRATEAGALRAATSFLASLTQPFTLVGQSFYLSASIGIAMYPGHGDDATSLLRHADVAMYRAKRDGDGYALYEAETDHHTTGRLSLIAELRQALESGGLHLAYQPKVDLSTGRADQIEALVRWTHRERGTIPPDEFIPLAEHTGLIRPLTEWVLNEAIRQASAWQEAGLAIGVAVNLSVWNLQDKHLTEIIARMLEQWHLPASLMHLEITESALMADPARALETVSVLHTMGVRIAIDDFGTGYSSLAYLRRLPVDELKIDQSFVLALADIESESRIIVRSVIDLGHNLSLKVVGEGVETQRMLDLLAAMGCDYAQGYHLSPPLDALDYTNWLTARESA